MNLKITSFVFALSTLTTLQKAGAQAWLWAETAGGSGAESATTITTDSSGNIYVAGDFTTSTISFGTHPVNNTSSGFADVFLVKYDANGTVLHAASGGGAASDHATAISADPWGNIYVAGYFYSPSVTFGGHTVTNAGPSGSADMYIVKYGPGGNVVWVRSAGGTGDDRINAIKADAAGNVVATGSFGSANLVFAPDTLKTTGALDKVFVVKYDTSGTYQWSADAGGVGFDYGNAITTDAAENVYVTGKFIGNTITFGDSVLTNAVASSNDMFLAKYNTSGVLQWARSAINSGNAVPTSIGADALGNVYVCGNFTGATVGFSAATVLFNSGANDIFLAKYNSSGGVLWATASGGTADDVPNSLVVDDSANVILAGNFASPALHFGGYTVTYDGSGISALFLTKYDAGGNARWAKTTGATHGSTNGVAFAPSGNLYVAGDYSDTTFWFGTDTIHNAINTGTSDIFVAKYSEHDFSAIPLVTTGHGMTVYPNPNNGVMMVSFKETGYDNIGIYDCTGKLIYQTHLSGNEQNVRIYASDLSDGVYMLRSLRNGMAENAAFVIRR